mgnify:CR=1 FL=1
MNKLILSIILTFLFSITTIADEGMWLPQLLQTMNEEDMIAHGLKLTAEDLYSVNNSSLKDAIVSGEYHPFTGPLNKQDGSVWLADGEVADDGALAGMTFYVEGIKGVVPN